MIKLLTELNISIGDIESIKKPGNNQMVINRSDMVIKRYTGGWTNFKIYSIPEFDNMVITSTNLHKGKLLTKVDSEGGKSLVDIDFLDEYYNKLNGIEYGANFYEHPTDDIHLSQDMYDLFNGYESRLDTIKKTKISSISKSGDLIDFKGSNNEVICSLLLKNIHLLEHMMTTLSKIEEILNKIRLQDLPDSNNLIDDYLNRLRELKDKFADMHKRIRKAEARLGIERKPCSIIENTEIRKGRK